MKKIVFISTLTNRGGTELSLLNFLKEIPPKKYDVTLMLLERPSDIISEVPEWIRIVILPCYTLKDILLSKNLKKIIVSTRDTLQKKLEYKLHGELGMRRYLLSLERYEAWNEEYDVAVSWNLPNSIGTVFTAEKIKAKKKLIWIHMDVNHDIPPKDAERDFEKYDRIYCVSRACKNSFDRKYPNLSARTKVFYNILNADEIQRKANAEINLAGDFVIVTSGRMSPEKQPFFAIPIAQKMKMDGYSFRWYFVGNGVLYHDMCSEIEKLDLTDCIILLGEQANPFCYVKCADLYVQMSRHESYCLTLAESQILGIPAVSTNFPAAYEIIPPSNWDYIVDNDWEKMYCKIKHLIQNKEELQVLHQNIMSSGFHANGSIDQFMEEVDGLEQ